MKSHSSCSCPPWGGTGIYSVLGPCSPPGWWRVGVQRGLLPGFELSKLTSEFKLLSEFGIWRHPPLWVPPLLPGLMVLHPVVGPGFVPGGGGEGVC